MLPRGEVILMNTNDDKYSAYLSLFDKNSYVKIQYLVSGISSDCSYHMSANRRTEHPASGKGLWDREVSRDFILRASGDM
jgi:hypothetical protein